MKKLQIGVSLLLIIVCVGCKASAASKFAAWKAPALADPAQSTNSDGNVNSAAPGQRFVAAPTELFLTTPPPHTPQPSTTPEPTTSPTPSIVWIPAGKVIAPILLYHHINDDLEDNIYAVKVDVFRQQLQYLNDQGYTTISIATLVKTIHDGGNLPAQPIVITFDDGYDSVYNNAYPIMKEFGFTGTCYLIGKVLDSGYPYLTHDQINELRDAGWEFGSHSMSHKFLSKMYDKLWYEVSTTKRFMSKYTGTKVTSFSYPFGEWDFIVQRATKETFDSGVGLGKTSIHTPGTIYYLSRLEIRSGTTLEDFINLIAKSKEEK